MTANSIAYAKQQEEARHNVVMEALEERKARESERHNVRSENITWYGTKEGERHNVTSEEVAANTLMENIRHNTEAEAIAKATLIESERHSKATEDLTQQSVNVESRKADNGYISAVASRISAAAASTSAGAAVTNAEANWKKAEVAASEATLKWANAQGETKYGQATLENLGYTGENIKQDTKTKKSQETRNYISGSSDLIRSFSSLLNTGANLYGSSTDSLPQYSLFE